MSSSQMPTEINTKLNHVRSVLSRELSGTHRACLTCSFQAEDVLLTSLAREFDPDIPILFLDTGYHFAETYAYRDQIASEWQLNLINLLPAKTVAEQEFEHGLLYQSAPDQCCNLRKVEPLFKAIAGYKVWFTGLRREQAKSRAALEESAIFTLPGGRSGTEARPARGLVYSRCVECVRTASDPPTATLRARLFVDRLRAVYHASAGSERPAIGPLGWPQSGVRHPHRGSAGKVR